MLAEQPSDGGHTHELLVNVRRLQWIPLTISYWVRREEPFHSLDVSGRCSVSLVHVTATDPLRSGRHADLVTRAVIAGCGADRMRAMANVVARKRRIIATWISNAVMNGVMPVVVVIGRHSIPPSVVRLQRIVCPTLASIRAANRNSLTSEPQRPDIRRVRVGDVRLDCIRLRSPRVRQQTQQGQAANCECADCLRFALRPAG